MSKNVEAFLWIVFILALSLSMACAPARVLFIPGACHPDEFIGDGNYLFSPNPCVVPRRP